MNLRCDTLRSVHSIGVSNMFLKCGAVIALLSSIVWGQTAINLATQGRNIDFSAFPFTRPIAVGSGLPATCQTGQLFLNTAANLGGNLYGCMSQNSWVVMGGYTLPPAGANTLGGVSVPTTSGLTLGGNGVLSINVGTAAGTVAAGNDARIVNALQPTSLIPAANITGLAHSATTDTTNASNITTGVLSAALLPSSVVQNSKVNTYTNQAVPATPATGNSSCWTDATNKNWECRNDAGTILNSVVASSGNTNQFATGISTSGIISYSQPSFSNLTGTIGSSQLGGTLGGDLAGSLPNPTVARVNGTSVPVNSNAHQALVTRAAASGSWASVPNCVDASGQHLNYNTSTHAFSCGPTNPGSSSPLLTTFDAIFPAGACPASS